MLKPLAKPKPKNVPEYYGWTHTNGKQLLYKTKISLEYYGWSHTNEIIIYIKLQKIPKYCKWN